MKNLRLTILFFFFVFFFLLFPSKILAIDLTFSAPPSEITNDQEFTIDVTLSGVDEGKSYYVKGAFFQETGKYFGFTKNNADELKTWSDDFTQMYKITGNQTVPITFKPDNTSSNFKGTGQYSFKLKRITEGGSETWHDQTASLTVNETSTPTNSPTSISDIPTNITLSEIYACSESGGNEWVEIYNNNDQEVTVTDWKIRDSSDSNKHQFSTTIPAHAYSIVELSSSILNNNGDSVKLVNPSESAVDEMSYASCKSERSWVKHDGTWKETLSITKGSANSFSPPTTESPDPTNTPKPSATPKPTVTNKPSATPKVSSTQPVLDENGELVVESTFSALESSPSRLVLGTETEESINLPSENQAEETTQQSNPKTAAIASLIIGGMIFTGIGGYLTWQWYRKNKLE